MTQVDVYIPKLPMVQTAGQKPLEGDNDKFGSEI